MSAVAKHFCAQLVLPCAAAAGQPVAMQITNFTAIGEQRPFSKCLVENGFIARTVMRRAECPAHGVINKSAARGSNLRHDIKRRSDHERGNPMGFDDVRDEANGLVAKRSIWHEQRRINLRALQFAGNSRGDFALDLLVAAQPTHERDVKR